MNNEIMALREEIAELNARLDKLEQEEKLKKHKTKFDPTEIINQPDIPVDRRNGERFYILVNDMGVHLNDEPNDGSYYDENLYNNNNYIPTIYPDAAEELLNITKFNMFLTRQKLIYCPNYIPDRCDPYAIKHFIAYNYTKHKFVAQTHGAIPCDYPTIYFETAATANKICDKLNNYLENCCNN